MIQLVYSPLWFRGKDIIIDLFSVIVILLIAFFSLKCYNLNKKNKNYFFLALSFIFMAFSFFFKILTNFSVYTKVIEEKKILMITYIYETIKPHYLFSFLSSELQKSFMLIGLYLLYVVLDKNKSRLDHFLIISLLLVITHLSHYNRHLFYYITALVLLLVITIKYYFMFKKNKQKTTKMLAYSFAIISISQFFFFFMFRYRVFYVIGEIVQLIGFIGLLVSFVLVLHYGKKALRKNGKKKK